MESLLKLIEQQRNILRHIFNDSDIDNMLWDDVINKCCFENFLKYRYNNKLKLIHNSCFENILSFIKSRYYNEILISLNKLRKLIKEELNDSNNNNM